MTPEEINELRIFALSMEPLMRILEKKKGMTTQNLIRKFNQNEDIVREAAKLSALNEFETEIRGKLRTFQELGNN